MAGNKTHKNQVSSLTLCSTIALSNQKMMLQMNAERFASEKKVQATPVSKKDKPAVTACDLCCHHC